MDHSVLAMVTNEWSVYCFDYVPSFRNAAQQFWISNHGLKVSKLFAYFSLSRKVIITWCIIVSLAEFQFNPSVLIDAQVVSVVPRNMIFMPTISHSDNFAIKWIVSDYQIMKCNVYFYPIQNDILFRKCSIEPWANNFWILSAWLLMKKQWGFASFFRKNSQIKQNRFCFYEKYDQHNWLQLFNCSRFFLVGLKMKLGESHLFAPWTWLDKELALFRFFFSLPNNKAIIIRYLGFFLCTPKHEIYVM